MNEILLKKLAQEGSVICRLPASEFEPMFALFSSPIFKDEIYRQEDVQKTFEKIEYFKKNGNYIVMCISYECAQAFDSLFESKKSNFPLLSYMVYDHAPEVIHPFSTEENPAALCFQKEIDFLDYQAHVNTLFQHFLKGNIYQANFSFQSSADALQLPEREFLIRFSKNPAPHSAFVHLKNYKILSFSPELFLSFDGVSHLKSKPMKGTAKRALTVKEDLLAINFLQNDIKNRSENLMIVDMVRNDFSKIKKVSSVRVDPLFEIETYPTVHQMVSTVHATIPSQTTLYALFKALFPAASITGAPKINALNILNHLEKCPRGIYTGAIGCILPSGAFSFNVAIRTLCCTKAQTTLGVGGGILYESTVQSEWEEAILKQQFTQYTPPLFNVFETLLWDKKKGYVFLEEHLKRAEGSQHYFSRQFNLKNVRDELLQLAQNLTENSVVKISFNLEGLSKITVEKPRAVSWQTTPLNIVVSKIKTDSKNLFFYHKTTYRPLYTQAYQNANQAQFDEVIFFNEQDELTEGAISNIFLKIDNQWLTPQTSCGLLEGIARNIHIQQLNAKETIINRHLLSQAQKVLLVNSVRGTGIVGKIEGL